MDDKIFDRYIKDKVEQFQDTTLDPVALADMKQKLAELPSSPGFKRYHMLAGFTAILAIFTLMNFLISRQFGEQQKRNLLINAQQWEEERKQFELLEHELELIKQTKTDTIYIYPKQTLGQGFSFTQNTQNSPPLNGYDQNRRPNVFRQNMPEEGVKFVQLAGSGGLSKEVKDFLKQHHLLIQDDKGQYYLKVSERVVTNSHLLAKKGVGEMYNPHTPKHFPVFDRKDDKERLDKVKSEKQPISAATLRALAKHNHHGLGWQFGVEGYLLRSNWDLGEGAINPGAGVLGEMIISPSLRLEFGARLNEVEYTINEIDKENLTEGILSQYPEIDNDLGELTAIDVESQILSLPVNLKYYYPLGRNKQVYFGIGYSPQLFLRQEFDYKYRLELDKQPTENLEVFVGANKDVDAEFYRGSVSASVGTEIIMDNKLRWQLGLFYERGLTETGIEGRKLNTFGLKSSIWWRVK